MEAIYRNPFGCMKVAQANSNSAKKPVRHVTLIQHSEAMFCTVLSGIPVVVDFAAMRDAVKALGGNPEKINPICPSDLVVDHSLQVDFAKS